MYKILVVDDEMIFRKGIRTILQKANFPIAKLSDACDGEEAFSLLSREEYNVVITDIRMPKMDGLMLCQAIRESKKNPVIIILSGYDDFRYAQRAIQYGVSDYILKPVSQSKLLETMEKVLKKNENRQRGFSYDDMDRIVSAFSEALWEREEEKYYSVGENLSQELQQYDKEKRQELFYEILKNVLRKMSRLLQQEACEEILQKGGFEEMLAEVWNLVCGHNANSMLEDVRRYLQSDPYITQEEISRRLGISPTHLSAVFKEKTGKRFVDFRTEVRMEQAKRLLCIPKNTITQAAAESGYADYSHFSRQFKKYYGVTPAQFREERGLSS